MNEKQHVRAAKRATRLESGRVKRLGEREARALTTARVPRESWPVTASGKPESLMCSRCNGKHEGFGCPNRRRRK